MSQTLTLSYDPREDRILAAVNVSQPDHWSCWLTRRLTLAVLEQTPAYLTQTSPLTQKTPIDYRSDLIQFEHQAAMAQTAPALSRTDNEVVRTVAVEAALAERLSLHSIPNGFVFELVDIHGQTRQIGMERAHLQRVLHMIADEAARAGWIAPAAPAAAEPGGAHPKPTAN
jgi:hypothetical protein